MAISSKQVTVTTEATEIFSADPDGAYVHVKANGAIWVGNSTVTTGTGYKMVSGNTLDLFVGPDEALYGIAAADTKKVWVVATLNQ
jgi:hypothetical protein